jgi:hypothetical protein
MPSIDAIYELGISHNKFGLALPDGTPYPEYSKNLTAERSREFLTHFDRVRDREWDQCSFLDLGCSEGSTTFEISQMGSSTCGVEGREDAVHRAEVLKSIVGFDNTYFSLGNVNDASSYRKVDAIFNAGILYHLDDPVACLERTTENARLFVYLDTGHAPRDESERQRSKFAAKFGRTFTIDYKGLELEAVDFAEPGNTAEKQADGVRRGPRSGIGNSNSVWLSHQSAIALMAKLGFPYHETIKDYPKIPRLRTAFFRTPPNPARPIERYLRPLEQLLPMPARALRIRERDTAYLRKVSQPVLLIGQEPWISQVAADLREADIAINEQLALDGGPIARGTLNEATKGKSGFVAVATDDVIATIRHIVVLDRFDYAFASFAMVRQAMQLA